VFAQGDGGGGLDMSPSALLCKWVNVNVSENTILHKNKLQNSVVGDGRIFQQFSG